VALSLVAHAGAAIDRENPQPSQPPFEWEVEAPPTLQAWLMRHAELTRFQTLPDLGPAELERLLVQAPQNLRDLLGTQGYFQPVIEIERQERPPSPPLIRVRVEPGEPTRVAQVQIVVQGGLQHAPEATAQRSRLEQTWGLPAGEVFTQSAWDRAKATGLRQLTSERYPRAQLLNSLADIDAAAGQAHLYAVFDSGPAHAFGDIQVEGAQRYEAEQVRRLVRLAGVRPGVPYQESLLLAAQQRLTQSGYFPSAFVLLAPDGPPEHHPVIARVREIPLQKTVVGVGASTDRGPRFSLEHTHHRLPSLGWQGQAQLQLEKNRTTLGLDLASPFSEQGWRWQAAARAERLQDGIRLTDTQQLRWGLAQEGPATDRRLFAQLDRSVSQDARRTVAREPAASLSLNQLWSRRAFDDLTTPRSGHGLTLEWGAGLTLSQAQQPYLRGRVRWLGYWPMAAEASARAGRWALRLEGGAVWARPDTPVPVTQRFLAGGDQSVRGYGVREIGVPLSTGGVEAGRWLGVASLEWLRPLHRQGQVTPWETALFVDAGAVAQTPAALKPQVGVGAGVRYNSPVGPLQADLAYGVERSQWRLHLSVGFTF
jgi:translocation and assembly module TamA